MTRFEKLQDAAESLSDEQVDALISLARSMKNKPFYDQAPTEALQSIDRGLAQIECGQTVTLNELSHRLARAARPGEK
jgi:predicted transcriptional regulator